LERLASDLARAQPDPHALGFFPAGFQDTLRPALAKARAARPWWSKPLGPLLRFLR
ncbi:MAG: hypothetical protein HY554_10805, partial [Elusimicrobia bacterium]|nr:hypothetical protein [Elusimicrobiota bacterium]